MKALWSGLLGGLALLVVSGCDDCIPKPEPVPFGLGQGDPSPAADETATEPTAFSPRVGEPLPAGTRSLAIGGGRYDAVSARVHLALRTDLDGDGDEDALLVTSDEGSVTLLAVKNERGTIEAEALGTFGLPESCFFHAGSLDQPEKGHVILAFRARCPLGEASAGAMLTLSPSPRVRKKIWLDAPRSESDAQLTLALSGTDRDEDGHLDLLVVALSESTPPVELLWLDRPGGFSLVDAQPKQTLEALLTEGRAQLEKDLEAASATAARLRHLASALCREGELPRLRVDDTFGVPCGRAFAPLADVLRLAVLVKKGELAEAQRLDRALREGATPELVRAIDEAWRALRASGVSLTKIADVPPAGGVDEWTAALGFDDEGALIHRGMLTRRYTFQGGRASEEVVLDRAPPVVDLEGRFAVEAIVKDCASVRARVVALDPETGVVLTDAVRREIQLAPADEHCERGSTGPRTWELVGWAPQGLLARRGATLRVIPLSVTAEPSGEPFDLGAGEALPSPIFGPHVARDGSVRLEAIAGAILVSRDGAPALVVRDKAWGEAPNLRSAAVSGDGSRVAILVDGALYVGTLPSP